MQELLVSFCNLIGMNTVEQWRIFRLCVIFATVFMLYFGWALSNRKDDPVAKHFPTTKKLRYFVIRLGIVFGVLIPWAMMAALKS